MCEAVGISMVGSQLPDKVQQEQSNHFLNFRQAIHNLHTANTGCEGQGCQLTLLHVQPHNTSNMGS